jgi:hypothetical protein
MKAARRAWTDEVSPAPLWPARRGRLSVREEEGRGHLPLPSREDPRDTWVARPARAGGRARARARDSNKVTSLANYY